MASPDLSSDDLPAVNPDFEFDTLATQLVLILERPRLAAFVLGLHGSWGSGKTTLMNAILGRLPDGSIVVDFNAWKYQDREALWRALIVRVLDALAANGGDPKKIAELQRSLYEAFTVKERGVLKINWTAAVTETLLAVISGASLGIGGGWVKSAAATIASVFSMGSDKEKSKEAAERIDRVAKVFEREATERAVRQVVSIEQFLKTFREVTTQLGGSKRVYVLIDDLDRCLPDTALEIFEAVKLFLDAPECAYVVAVDRAVIRRGLELRYPRRADSIAPPVVDPDEYIEKTITLSFDLPMLSEPDGLKLIADSGLSTMLSEEQAANVVTVLGTNPRRLKRFSAMLRLWFDVAKDLDAKGCQVAFSPLTKENCDLFLKVALIGYINSAVITHMLRDSKLSERLQMTFNAAANQNTAFDAQQELSKQVQHELPIIQDAVLEPG
jgi:hypothetical protein